MPAQELSQDDIDLLQSFIVESRDMLDEVEPQLIELQQSVDDGGSIDSEVINSIFRLFHTMKGSAGFLNLNQLAKVTHEAETLLDLFRQKKAQVQSEQTNLMCRACDLIRILIDEIEEKFSDSGHESEIESITKELAEAIQSIKDGGKTPKSKQPDPGNDKDVKKKDKKKKSDSKSAKTSKSPSPTDGVIPPDDPLGETDDPEDVSKFIITSEMTIQFVQEADELLAGIEQNLLKLEDSPKGGDQFIDEAFRFMHSFKGNSGIMGYKDINQISHKTETVLECLKDGIHLNSDDTFSLLLSIVDVLKEAVADISNNGSGKIGGVKGYIALIDEILPAGPEEVIEGKGALGEILVARGDVPPEAVEEALDKQNKPLGEILVDMGYASPEAVTKALKDQSKDDASRTDVSKRIPKIKRQDIRVDVEKLDTLINLVGELVIAESLVTNNRDIRGQELENFERAAHGLNLITSDLQDVAMSVRMIPIASTFRKMIRLVHDLANKAGKKVKLDLVGEDTEVDKNVIELIGDPLIHMVRNAVDHGIDTPEERKAVGKPETGNVTIEAKHEGGEVWVSITDNGRGLDRDKILEKAREKGLVNGNSDKITDDEIYKLIFEPGFSTADKITDISGRGVGMDVVKKNVEKLKGHIEIHSKKNEGTTIHLRIPLTLAIIDGMMVRVGDKTYTIPINHIIEFFRPDELKINILANGQEVVKLREKILPIVRLHDLYDIEPDSRDLDKGILGVLETRGSQICLFIDEVLGQQQTVIKGLSDYIGNIQGISGCTILGTGDISLIIDVSSLFELAKNTNLQEVAI